MTNFDQSKQRSENQYNAVGDINIYQQVPIRSLNSGTLREAEQRLAALPLESIPDPSNLPTGSRMLFAHNPLFVGRETYLKAVASTFKGNDIRTSNNTRIVSVSGIGGIGKTQFASEFVHRYGQYFVGGVFWLSFADANAVRAEVAACYTATNMEMQLDVGRLSLGDQVRLVLSSWQGPSPCLLIFDNCEEEELLAQWRPPTGACRILVTSRRPNWSPELGVNVLSLDAFSRIESISLLREHRPDLLDSDLNPIADILGDLPLALHLAGSFLNKYRNSHLGTPTAYLAQLNQVTLQHLSLQGRGVSYSATGHELNVERTFALSYQRLNETDVTDRQALSLLANAACFAPGEPIPGDLLRSTKKQISSDILVELQIEDALERLVALGLLEPQKDATFRLHRLLAAFVRMRIGLMQEEAQTAVEQATLEVVKGLNKAGFPSPILTLQPHLRLLTNVAMQRQDAIAAALCTELGTHLKMIGVYVEAQFYTEQALTIRQQSLGLDHPDVAQSLNDLGMLYGVQGHYEQAEPLCQQALAIQKKALGPDHPDIVKTLWSYAALLRKTKQYEEAINVKKLADTLQKNWHNEI